MREQRRKYAALAAVGIAPLLVNGCINAKIASLPALYWAFELFTWIGIPIAVLTSLVRNAGLRASDLGFSRTIFHRRSVVLVLVSSFLFCLIAYAVYTEAYSYMRTILPDAGIFQYRSVLPATDPGRSLVTLYFALSAGIVEEIYFRGLLFKIATFVRGTVPVFLILSPILFAAIHWESGMANMAAAYVYGLVSAIAYVFMRNVWPLVAGHVYTDYVTPMM